MTNLYINKQITTGTGVQVSHHHVLQVRLADSMLTMDMEIESWHTENQRLTGYPPVARAIYRLPISGLGGSTSLVDDLRAGIVGPAGLYGGVVVSDITQTLEGLKALKRTQINVWRDEAMDFGFYFGGHLVSTDAKGMQDISGTNGSVTLTGTFPEGWAGYWKAKDNFYIPIPDIQTWKLFYGAMSAQGVVNFAKSEALKSQLALAQGPADVEAVVWPT
jgi:hypothetical protein